MDEKFKYALCNENLYYKNHQSRVKIPYLELKEFTDSMNFHTENVRVEVIKSQDSQLIWDSIYFFAAVAIVLLITIFFSFYLDCLNPWSNILFTVGILIVGIVIILNYLYKLSNNRKKNKLFDKYESFLVYQDKIENIVSRWNEECFAKYNISAEVPEGLEYVQFFLKPSIRMKIVPHDI
jgi:hypothetical protein